MIPLTIQITEAEFAALEQTVRDHGFDSIEAYLKALLLEPPRTELLQDVRDGLLAIERGDPMPTLDDLWNVLDHPLT